MNKELYDNLASATRYCQLVEQGIELIQTKQEEVKEIEMNHKRIKVKKTDPFEICICIIGFISFSTIVFFIAGILTSTTIVTSVTALLLVVELSVIIFAIINLRKIENEFKIIYQNETEPQMVKCLKEIEEIKEAMEKFGESNSHLLDFLPSKYRNLEATSYMLMVVSDRRAETLKEAMNLYEEQLHRWKLEDLAQKNAEIQEYMADALDELNARQAETNAHLSAIEQMEFIEYLHKQ